MSLKTSFFNKSLIKSDLKRFWWVSALHTLLVFLAFGLIIIQNASNGWSINGFRYDGSYVNSDVYSYSVFVWLFSLGFPVLTGGLLFSYLQSGKASATMHSIPVLRKTHYCSHYVSGIILFTAPLIINAVILWLFKLDPAIAQNYRISHVFYTMGIAFIYSVLAFSLTALVAQITGNTIANFVFVYIFAVLPVMAEAFISFFLESQLYGYSYNGAYSVSQFLYKFPHQLMQTKNILFYLAISILFAVAGYVLYRFRKLEKHSEVVSFSSLVPVFVYGVGLCVGAFGYAYLNGIWGCENPLYMIPFGIVGIIIAEMISKKSFKVFGVYKKLLVYSVFIVLLFSFFHFDLVGYERRVPAVDKVESVLFEQHFNSDNKYSYIENTMVINDYYYEPVITSPDEIALVTQYHNELCEKRNEKTTGGRTITLMYTLKNGKTMQREYLIDYAKIPDVLGKIVETDTIRQAYFPLLRPNERNNFLLQVQDLRLSEDFVNADDDLKQRLIDALKEDLKNAEYKEYIGRKQGFTSIRIGYNRPAHYEDGTPVPTDVLSPHYETYYIRISYKNTIAILEEIGFYDALPTAEDVVAIGVERYKYGYPSRSVEYMHNNTLFRYNKLIENPDEIKEVFDWCKQNIGGYQNYASSSFTDELYLDFFLKNGHRFNCTIFGEDNPPECLLSE